MVRARSGTARVTARAPPSAAAARTRTPAHARARPRTRTPERAQSATSPPFGTCFSAFLPGSGDHAGRVLRCESITTI